MGPFGKSGSFHLTLRLELEMAMAVGGGCCLGYEGWVLINDVGPSPHPPAVHARILMAYST